MIWRAAWSLDLHHEKVRGATPGTARDNKRRDKNSRNNSHVERIFDSDVDAMHKHARPSQMRDQKHA
jgi:hypothetical protein